MSTGAPLDQPDASDVAESTTYVRDGGRLQRDARTVATALRVAVLVLSVPAFLLAVGAATAFLVHGVLATVALTDGMRVMRWIWLAVALAAVTAAVLLLVRVIATRRAASDPDALADELIGLVDISAVTAAVLADLAEITGREGGARPVSRARALWRMLRRLDVAEHVSGFERARWFVPPEIGGTWVLTQVALWGGLAAWALLPAVIAARAAGWL